MLQKTIFNFINYALEIVLRKFLKAPFRLNVRYKRILSLSRPNYVLLHGLADTGELWKPILHKLPADANYIVLDLLGHGDSKVSKAKVYSARYQARNVITTCLNLGLIGDYTFIGHSFGSLVSIECARLMPKTRRLVLCSPPLYNKPKNVDKIKIDEPETILFKIYNEIIKYPKSIIAAYNLSNKLGLLGSSRVSIESKTFQAFVETLQSGIINQQSINILSKLNIPIAIIYGRLDPLVISKNIDRIAKYKPNITVRPVINDHSIRTGMFNLIVKTIRED